jgi:hypothetical protein
MESVLTMNKAFRRRSDHLFFSGMAVFIFAVVFLGFAHTYYLAGMFRAPLPSIIVHIHGAVFFELDHLADCAMLASLLGASGPTSPPGVACLRRCVRDGHSRYDYGH